MDAPVDVVVLGGDLAGGVAAAAIAKAGGNVQLVAPTEGADPERLPARTLWGSDLERLAPGAAPSLPAERSILQHRFGFLTPDASVFFDFQDAPAGSGPPSARTLRTSELVGWSTRLAAAAGAATTTGARRVTLDGDGRGRISGLTVDGAPLSARLVLLADPVWARQLDPMTPPREVAAAGLWRVEEDAIDRRFSVRPGEGAALRCVLGNLAPPLLGIGSVTTLSNAVELRVTVNRSGGPPTADDARSALSSFASHPAIAPFVRGGVSGPVAVQPVVEWPGVAAVARPGVWRIGEAAGLRYSNLLVERDASLEVRSGNIAAEAASPHLRGSDLDRPSAYQRGLSTAGITAAMQREQTARRWRWDPRIHREYSALLARLFRELMTETGEPKRRIATTLREVLRSSGIGWTPLIRDGLAAGDLL